MTTGWTVQAGSCCVVLAVVLVACGDHGSEPSAPPTKEIQKTAIPSTSLTQIPATVRDRLRTELVTSRAVPEVVTAPGEVSLDLKQVAKITSRIEGQIDKIYAQLGDHVRRGQPLAAIVSLQLDQLIQEYLVAKAQADVAENSFRRTEKLLAEQIVTERRYVEERGRHLESKARFQHVREKLLNMGLTPKELGDLEQSSHEESHRYTLTSPLTGTVVNQQVVLGQGVAPGNELFEVVDTSRVWIFANLPIEQARKFKEGDQGTIVPKGGESITALLTYLAPVADEATRTIRVRFEVANSKGQLKPREYVDVRLTINGSPSLSVPASAVTLVDNVRGVFVQRGAGYTFVPVEIGREGGGWIEVRKGLAEGEQVTTEGVLDLKSLLLKQHIESGEGN